MMAYGNLKVVTYSLLVVLCEDYAKGLLSITFHLSKVAIFVTAGSMQTPHNWMRVKVVHHSCQAIYHLCLNGAAVAASFLSDLLSNSG